jgi:hypothetical protein
MFGFIRADRDTKVPCPFNSKDTGLRPGRLLLGRGLLDWRLLDRRLLDRRLLSGLHAAVLFRFGRLPAGLLLAPLLVLPLGHMDRVLIVSRYGGDGAVEKPGVGVWVVRVDGLLAATVHANLRRHLSSAFGIENRERQLARFAGKIKRRPVRDGRVRALVMLACCCGEYESGSEDETYQHVRRYAPWLENTPAVSSFGGERCALGIKEWRFDIIGLARESRRCAND